MSRIPKRIESEDLILLTNETTGQSSLKKLKTVGKYSVLFDYTEPLIDSFGNPYQFSIIKASLEEKEQFYLDSVKKAISAMVNAVNGELQNKIHIDLDKVVSFSKIRS